MSFGLMASCQIWGIILVIKWFQNWFFQEILITENVLLKWYSSMKKKLRKIWMIFYIENWLWKLNFGTFWKLAVNLKFNNFLSKANFFLILYPPFENSTTCIAILFIKCQHPILNSTFTKFFKTFFCLFFHHGRNFWIDKKKCRWFFFTSKTKLYNFALKAKLGPFKKKQIVKKPF